MPGVYVGTQPQFLPPVVSVEPTRRGAGGMIAVLGAGLTLRELLGLQKQQIGLLFSFD